MEAPVINVGIMTHKAVSFVFNEEYVHTETGTFTIGEQRALWVNGKIVYNGKLYQELFFEPTSPQSSFDLKAVTIGVDFHWQRQEDQRFKGALNLVATDKGIVTINQVDVEEYLTSVISSEIMPYQRNLLGDERQRLQRVAESPCRDLAKLALGAGREEFQLERIGYAL